MTNEGAAMVLAPGRITGGGWPHLARALGCEVTRDELLNETLFSSLAHARAALAEWRLDYNTVRPHSSLGNLSPVDYATLSAPVSQRDGTLRAIGGYAPRPVAAPSQTGSNG